MKTDYIKWIITTITGLTTVLASGGRLAAQTVGTTEPSTYSDNLSKAPKAAPTIKITYPKLSVNDKNPSYVCAGDTVMVEITADNIKDFTVPQGNDWEGDEFVHKDGNTVTRRFFTYHPFLEADPTQEKERLFTFTIQYNNGTPAPIDGLVNAKSCPPSTLAEADRPTLTTPNYGRYNLGFANFTIKFDNRTSEPGKIKFDYIVEPDQFIQLYTTKHNKYIWELTNMAVPVSTATYTFKVTYNEGKRTGCTAVLGPFRRSVETLNGQLEADATAYCTDEPITFTLTIPDAYEKMLLQKTGGKKDLTSIGQCFEWKTPAGKTVRLDDWDEATHTYKFSTPAAGSSKDYQCKMQVQLEYQSDRDKAIDTTFQVEYDIPIKEFGYHSAASFKRTPMEAFACQGATINLQDSLSDETKPVVQQIELSTTSPTSGFTTGSSFVVPASSTKVYARITTNFSCPLLGNTFIDSIQVNVTPNPKITEIRGISDGMEICAGTSLNVSAAVTPEKTDVMWQVDGVQVSDKPSAELSLSHDATVTVQASNTCPPSDVQSFAVKVNALPQVSMTSLIEQCPGTTVTLSGSGNGGNPNYQLRDLKTNQPIAPTGFDAATGLTNYPLKEGDDLELTYTAYNGKCPASATARITAHPLPEVQITYDGQAYRDGATICVPRNQPLTLTASGTADSYLWDNNTTTNQATYNMPNDQSITVEGTENTHGCKNTVKVYGVVSVNPVGSTAKSICPGEEVRFTAENDLPNTEYVWRDPQGNSVGNSHEYHASDLQPGQEGEYKLEITRSTCTWEPLTYQLAFHPYPSPKIITVSSEVCEGTNVNLQVYSGMTDDENKRATFRWEKADGTFLNNRPNIQIPNISKGDAGLYRAIVTSADGCEDNATLTLSVGEHITPVFSLAAAYCEDEEETLTTATTGDGYTYRWFTDSRNLNTEETQSMVRTVWQRNDNGTLYLEIKQNGCIDTTGKPLNVIPRPHLSGMPQDTGLCTGMPLCIKPVSDIKPDQITWFFIGENGKVTPLEQGANPDLTYCWAQVDALMNGRYFVDATVNAAHKNCVSHSDTMKLTVYPLPDIRIEGPNFICDGDTVTLTAVSQTEGSNRWSPSGQTTETIAVTKAGRYGVTRISTYGCRDSAETRLEARPLPYFSLPPDTSICRGTSFMIYGPENMDTYLWNDGSEEKDRLADDGGWYILTVFRNECPFTDSLYVHESFCGQFHFPTAFSPNDNRVNDTWGAISAAKDEDMAEYDLMVFDRNGKKVFHGKRISEQWDGKYKGQLCPPGVYTYSFRALEKEEGIKYRSNGTVTIVL